MEAVNDSLKLIANSIALLNEFTNNVELKDGLDKDIDDIIFLLKVAVDKLANNVSRQGSTENK